MKSRNKNTYDLHLEKKRGGTGVEGLVMARESWGGRTFT